MLTLRAAKGLKIPSMGFLELEIDVDGVKVPSCRVLVIKDTPATSQQRYCSPQREPDLPAGITLTDFPRTPALKQGVLRILTSYVDVFARDGEELGCTTTIQHSIPTRMPAS